jgi:hypothetical protein
MDIYAQFVPEGQKQAQKQLRAYVERAVPNVSDRVPINGGQFESDFQNRLASV